MSKVLFLPLNYGDVIQEGWYDAFRQAGCTLEVFDYMERSGGRGRRVKPTRKELLKIAKETRPDLIFMQIQHTNVIDGRTVLEIKQALPKTIIANWTGDVRANIPKTYKAIAKVSDFNFISSTGQLDMFRKQIPNVKYLQIGYNPKIYHPNPDPKKKFQYDAVFVGNNPARERYPGKIEREEVCRILRGTFKNRFLLHGNGWPKPLRSKGSINQKQVMNAYHNSFCAISVSHFNDIPHYFSDRLLMCMASGRPTISLKFPNWESYFTDNCDLIIADSVKNIVDKVKYLLDNRGAAEFIGKSGAEKVRSEHCYLNRCNELLDVVGLR